MKTVVRAAAAKMTPGKDGSSVNKHKRDSDLPSVSLPPPERHSDAEVMSLSERFEANRDQFEDFLRQIERLIGSFPPTAAMRANNLAEDDAKAG
jgi:hypothetical protein